MVLDWGGTIWELSPEVVDPWGDGVVFTAIEFTELESIGLDVVSIKSILHNFLSLFKSPAFKEIVASSSKEIIVPLSICVPSGNGAFIKDLGRFRVDFLLHQNGYNCNHTG